MFRLVTDGAGFIGSSLVGKKTILNKLPIQNGDVLITFANISNAQKLLNYYLSTSLEDGKGLFNNYLKYDK